MLPTAIKPTATNDFIILDFMNEENVGEQTKYISYSAIALTRDHAQNIYDILGVFLKIPQDQKNKGNK